MDKSKKIKKKSSRTGLGRRKKANAAGQNTPLPPFQQHGVPNIPSLVSVDENSFHSPVRLNGPTKRPYSGLESLTRPSALDDSPSTPKRSRSATWTDQTVKNNTKPTIEIPEPSQHQPSPTPSPVRRSRFIEHQTSIEYFLGDQIPQLDGSSDDASHALKQSASTTKDTGSRNSVSSSVPNSGAPSQDSSFFRFGKSIASAFRPISVWSNLSSIWKQNHPVSSSSTKQSLSSQSTSQVSRLSSFHPRGSVDQENPDSPAPCTASRSGNGGSAIDIGFQSSPSSLASLNATKAPESIFDSSASSPTSSPQKTPVSKLLTGLKSKKSAPSLSTSASRSSVFLPTAFSNASAETFRTSVSKSPSKKDLRRHKKLTKKVSDLEDKLDRAKRELNRALVDAPPVPPIPDKYAIGSLPRVSTVAEFASEVNDELAMKRYSAMTPNEYFIPITSSASSSPSKASVTAPNSDNEEILQTIISSLQKDDDRTPPRRKSPVARLSLPRILAKLSPESEKKEHAKRKADSEVPASPTTEGPRPNKLRRSSPSSSTSDSSEKETFSKIPSIPKEGKSYIPVAVADPEKKTAAFPPRSIPVIVEEDTEPYEWPEDVF